MAVRDILDILLLGTACEELATDLRQRQHRVFPVSRAEAAVAMLSVRPFDLIVVASQPTDIGLAEAVARLRTSTDARAAMAPLIARDVSGHDKDKLLAAGADHILAAGATLDSLAMLAMSANTGEQDPRTGVAPAETSEGRNLLRLLRETLRRQLAALDPAVFRPDHLTDIAHRLKGSAANFGYMTLGATAHDAMHGTPHDQRRIDTLAGSLRQEIEKALRDIDRRLNAGTEGSD